MQGICSIKRENRTIEKVRLVSADYEDEFTKIIDKACLCEDLQRRH